LITRAFVPIAARCGGIIAAAGADRSASAGIVGLALTVASLFPTGAVDLVKRLTARRWPVSCGVWHGVFAIFV
jgi:hypothetical protein